jgi:ABC-type Mn2+/Zn2+ transport system permease subunit
MEKIIGLLGQFQMPVIAGLVAGGLCPLIGIFFVMRRMVLLGIALPQVGSAGVAFVIMTAQLMKLQMLQPGQSPFLAESTAVSLAPFGAVAAILLMLLFLAWCEARSPYAEARWGTVYVTSAALLILFLVVNPYAEAHIATLVEGRIITVTAAQLRILVGAAIVVVILFLLFRKEILLSSFDPEMAISLGLRPSRWDGLLYLLMGLVISTGVMSMGPLFVFGYLLLPAFAVRPWVAGIKRFALFSVILGIVSAFAGSLLGFWFDWPLGPAEVATAALFLFASRLFHLLYKTVALKPKKVAAT